MFIGVTSENPLERGPFVDAPEVTPMLGHDPQPPKTTLDRSDG